MRARGLAMCLALAAAPALAVDTPAWPPSPEAETRMHELQQVIRDPHSTLPQREAAREELAAMLKSPAGQLRGRALDEKPARAAIQPFPSVVKPLPALSTQPSPPDLAHIEIVEPPKPVVIPRSGAVLIPSPANPFAVDPRSGRILHEVPGGYVDPRTGQLSPR
jgi:hypothetical protein